VDPEESRSFLFQRFILLGGIAEMKDV